MKLYNTLVAGKIAHYGFDKFDTPIQVQDDHSFIIEDETLGKHLLETCPHILDEEDAAIWQKTKSIYKKDADGKDTSTYLNRHFVSPEPVKAARQLSETDKKMDYGRVIAENKELKAKIEELTKLHDDDDDEDDSAKDQIDNLRKANSVLSQNVQDNGKTISDLKTEIDTLKSEYADKDKALTEANDKLKVSEENVHNLEEKVKTLEGGADAALQAELKNAKELLEKIKGCTNVKDIKALFPN